MIGKKGWSSLVTEPSNKRKRVGDGNKTDVNFSWLEEICTQYSCIEDLSLLLNNAVTCQDSVP